MKILFIAPLPPPISGQTKASKVLYDSLIKTNQVEVINFNKKTRVNSPFLKLNRFFEVLKILNKIWINDKKNTIIYLSLSESFLGNIKDLFTYAICIKSLSKMYIHMLGGAGMKKILESKGLQRSVNYYFLKRLGGVFVEGKSNFEVFNKILPKEKIHIVPNFAENYLFVTELEIKNKFKKVEKIHILFLSNLLEGKGYNELADAYLSLNLDIQNQVKITFVGGFENENYKHAFLLKIKDISGLNYLGPFIDGEEKLKLYCETHIFCLPTYYPFEGQPISILEAYATGCVVITTNHSGIPNIFIKNENGFLVEKKSSKSIKDVIENVIENTSILLPIGINNNKTALEKYRTSSFTNSINLVLNSSIKNEK